ncbi:MAG: pitrilysin family protein [Candidatus Dormibacteria bacterium]|jgi:predicted Zn-dependent peptidase
MSAATETYELYQLPSGARLIAAPMRERRSAAVAFMFGVGSRHEERATAGLSHFIEHVVFKGGGSFPTARAISEAIESVGGSINASTDKEATIFYAKVPAEHLAVACEVLGGMTFAPVLDVAEVAKERQVVVEELRMSLDNPQDHVGPLFDEVMYPDQPLGWDVAGTEETVGSFDVEACREHLSRHYRPARLVVSVAGAVLPGQARELVERSVGRLGEAAADPPAPAEEGHGSALRFINKRTEQANVILGGYACSYLDPRRHVLDLLNVVLGEGMSSRLFQELREERALAYDVHSFAARLRDSGCLGIYIGCEPRRAVEAVGVAVDELARLGGEGLGDGELSRAKQYAKGRLLLHLEGTGATSQFLGQQELLAGEVLLVGDVVAAIEAVSAEEVRAMAEEICRHGLRAAVIGPFAKPERFEKALARAS